MPHPARFIPALIGLLILGLMLVGEGLPVANLCRIARNPPQAAQYCLAIQNLPAIAAVVASALIALTLILLLRWQRARPRSISYESDAGRWVVLGWILAIGGAVSLMVGMFLIGSGGWPFSEQSRHINLRTGQLPLVISTVQRRYFANYLGSNGLQSLCAGFGSVTIRNRSSHRHLALDLDLTIAPRHVDGATSATHATSMPSREDLAAIARRGLVPQAIFNNPIELRPRESLRKELVFVIRPGAGSELLSDRDYAFSLAVKDRLTGQTVSFTLPAEYRG